eukprot:SAG31_NODE_1033_length_10230_cov_15.289014_1_plen_489_part_00
MDELSRPPGTGDIGVDAFDNPLSGGDCSPTTVNSGRMVEVPDYYGKLRPLLAAADGTPRWFVRFSPLLTAWHAVLYPVSILLMYWLSPTVFEGDLDVLRMVFMCLPYGGTSHYVMYLLRAIAEDGPLAQLGAGTAMLPASQLKKLRLWMYLLLIPALGCFLFGLVVMTKWEATVLGVWIGVLDGDVAMIAGPSGRPSLARYWTPSIPIMLPMTLSFMVGYPSMLAWFFSMKLATALAKQEVERVVREVKPITLADDVRWSGRVAQPSLRLATSTMRHLSDGWGTPTAFIAMVLGLAMLSNFVGVVHMIRIGLHQTAPIVVLRRVSAMAVSAAGPFIIAVDAARVSTSCDELLQKINDLRMTWNSTEAAKEVHDRTFPLQHTLQNHNNGMGMGFKVLGMVLNVKTLQFISLSLGSLLVTVIPVMMALMPDEQLRGEDSPQGETVTCMPPGELLGVVAQQIFGATEADGHSRECVPLSTTFEQVVNGSAW